MCLPASDRRLDGLAFIIPFLDRSFCFDFPLPARDICGYMICGARYSVLLPCVFCDEQCGFFRVGLGHHCPTPSVQSVHLSGRRHLHFFHGNEKSRSNSRTRLVRFHPERSGLCGGLHNSWRQGPYVPFTNTRAIQCEIFSQQTLLFRSVLLLQCVGYAVQLRPPRRRARTFDALAPHINCVLFYAPQQLSWTGLVTGKPFFFFSSFLKYTFDQLQAL